MPELILPSRRLLLAAGLGLLAAPAFAAGSASRLRFQVFRNGSHIGEHLMTFRRDAGAVTAATEVSMTVKLGPVPVYRYRHTATERWSGGAFKSLRTATNGNGRRQDVAAEATGESVEIDGSEGRRRMTGAAPLTHWNTAAFSGPLFNPQTGKPLRVQVRRAGAGHWTIRGEAEIDNFYDADGDWRALTGKLEDGSRVEYRLA